MQCMQGNVSRVSSKNHTSMQSPHISCRIQQISNCYQVQALSACSLHCRAGAVGMRTVTSRSCRAQTRTAWLEIQRLKLHGDAQLPVKRWPWASMAYGTDRHAVSCLEILHSWRGLLPCSPFSHCHYIDRDFIEGDRMCSSCSAHTVTWIWAAAAAVQQPHLYAYFSLSPWRDSSHFESSQRRSPGACLLYTSPSPRD